jgi:hypothetical protein
MVTTFDAVIRAGYPQGVPQDDYVPLLALLRRRLPDNAVAAVATHVAAMRLEHRCRRYPRGWPDSRVGEPNSPRPPHRWIRSFAHVDVQGQSHSKYVRPHSRSAAS